MGSEMCIRDRSQFVQFLGPKVSPSDAAILLNLGEFGEYSAGDEILTEQVSADKMFFVWSGSPSVFVREKHVGNVQPGTFLGEISFLTKKPCTATVRIESTPTELICWDIKKLAAVLQKRPTLRETLTEQLTNQLSEKLQVREKQLETLSLKPSRENDETVLQGLSLIHI